MNYTGNPRHLRSRPRASKLHPRRQRLNTPAASERPALDICSGFQDRTSQTTSESRSVATSDDNNTFDAKRRRLLLQSDWLGLEVSAPIKVPFVLVDEIYDIRAEKERKRLENGPFMTPLFHQPTELTTLTPPPSHHPASPAQTSNSSTSLRPEPTIPSMYSSQHGSGFVPSQYSSPLIAHRGSSTSSNATWNSFTPHSERNFIPNQTEQIDFYANPEKDHLDMKTVWNLVEERKLEDQLLCAEFGWEAQSASQMSQQQSQRLPYEQTETSIYELQENLLHPITEMDNPRICVSQRHEGVPITPAQRSLSPLRPSALPVHCEVNVAAHLNQLQISHSASNQSDFGESASPARDRNCITVPNTLEDAEDEGIPWF
jgi:hypothetical protein